MASNYRTIDGDMVDAICYRHYGNSRGSTLEAVLTANPGLAARGPVLPAGVDIYLPDIAQPTTDTPGQIQLWQ